MVKFNILLASASATDFKFVSQTRVSLVTLLGNRIVSYSLSKDDVVTSIQFYISCIHSLYYQCAVKGLPYKVRCEGMNFKVLKMFDLVPYLYTLINYYLTLRIDGIVGYNLRLPELKITRFCHLPFGSEIILPKKEDLVIEYTVLTDRFRQKSRFLTYINSTCFCAETKNGIIDCVRVHFPFLFDKFNVSFRIVGS